MIGYNLYYGGERINSKELSEEDVSGIRKKAHIYYYNKKTNEKTAIKTCKIQVIPCVIIS